VLFATAGAVIKESDLSNWQIAGLRSAVAAVTLFLSLPDARRRPSLVTVGVALAYAATMMLFVTANKLTTAANAVLLQATAPLHLLYLAPWVLRERIAPRDLLWLGVLGIAVALFFADAIDPIATAPDPLLGNVLSVSCGLTWAVTVLGLRWLAIHGGPRESTASAVLTGNLVAALVCLPLAFPLPQPMPAKEWLIVGYLGVFQVAAAYVLLLAGIGRVPVFAASLLLLTEDALNPVFVWIVHDEIPGRWALAGGAIILAAAVVRAWAGRPRQEAGGAGAQS
jgi:drug/metabolite transporter (DMT)-like permease